MTTVANWNLPDFLLYTVQYNILCLPTRLCTCTYVSIIYIIIYNMMVDYFCISNLVHIPYLMERMIQFNISSLSSRRRTAKLCHLYKVIYRLVDCENAPVAHRALQYSCRRSNQAQIQTLFAQSSQYQFSFYPHSISLWNSLVINNESLSSLATFKYFTTAVM